MRNLPVGEGRTRVSASVGGPWVDVFGTTIPLPYSLAGVTYGMSERVNLHADLHLTAAAYRFLGVTPGATWFPDLPLGPFVTAVSADALVFADFRDTRVYPELSATITHVHARKWRPYAGFCNTFQFTRAPHHMLSPYIGTSFAFRKWQPYVELKWLAAGHDNRFTPVNYHGIGERGALATQFGLALNLGGSK
jgi:hypothetical protein